MAVNESMGYGYTGAPVGVTLKKAGYYKLEVWGAQGGSSYYTGGYGGYSTGVYSASNNAILYFVIGEKGRTGVYVTAYNGGGESGDSSYSNSGGGLTHIATRTGVLSSLSSYQSSVLIVAGGGGGATGDTSSSCPQRPTGGSGGGMVGGAISNSGGGTQTGRSTSTEQCDINNCGGGFGYGGAGGRYSTNNGYHQGGGGGGGWFGGNGSGSCFSGGGGSGYIGNALLLSAKGVTKQMYQYSTECTSSTAAATKTTCTGSTGAHVANAANTGNGYAKITYLGT